MARKETARKSPPPQDVLDRFEAEAGIYPLPITVAEGPEAYQPEILILAAVDGPIFLQELERPGLLLARAGFLLRGALKRLQYLPGILRVPSPELAEALRAQITSRVRLICEPTPHLDGVVALLASHMTKGVSYLAAGAGPGNVGAFFRAAAALYRVKPWTVIPPGGLIGVTIEALGVHNAALLLVAPDPQVSPGWMLAEKAEDFELLGEAHLARDKGREADFPAIQTFQFENFSSLPPGLAREIREHGWETAGDMCPWIGVAGEEGEAASPGPAAFAVSMAISLALANLVQDAGGVKKAFAGKTAPMELWTPVELFGGRKLEVVLAVPYFGPAFRGQRPDHPLLGRLHDLEGGEIDREERRRLETELLGGFAATAGGKNLGDLEWLRLVLDLAAERLGFTAASIGAPQLESLLFQAVPRSVQIAPADAARLAAECTAFFRFLRDDCGHPLAGGALEVLERENTIADLETAFGDASRFGIGKSLLAAGEQAGFDVQSAAGIEAWLKKVNETGLPPGVPLHPFLGDLDSLPLAPKSPRPRRKGK